MMQLNVKQNEQFRKKSRKYIILYIERNVAHPKANILKNFKKLSTATWKIKLNTLYILEPTVLKIGGQK
jgi:hypothetical protein